jgi:hypothetical protein
VAERAVARTTTAILIFNIDMIISFSCPPPPNVLITEMFPAWNSLPIRTLSFTPTPTFRGAKSWLGKMLALVAASGLLIGSYASGLAQTSAQEKTPGDQMQDKGSVKGSPGASGYAPGHVMKKKGSATGTTWASGYAPGHVKTDAT